MRDIHEYAACLAYTILNMEGHEQHCAMALLYYGRFLNDPALVFWE